MKTSLTKTNRSLDSKSCEIRRTVVNMMKEAKRGHFASALSVVEILRVLYDDILRYDPLNPRWPERDRFILSKGHGCMSLYVILAEKGFFSDLELWKFCKSDGILGGHPEYGKVPGIEASTGSLGHGLSIGVGFALNAIYEKKDYRTFILIGDGESNEGSIWEAALSASKHKLSNLTVIIDYNKQQSYDSTFNILDLEPIADKWSSFGFSTIEVDGHDIVQLREVLSSLPINKNKPNAVICHTVKGKGISFVEGNLQWHHKNSPTDEDIDSCLKELEKN